MSSPTLPIMRAVAEGDAPALKALLAQGTDVNCRNQSGQTPLMMAALLGHSAIVPLLLEFGADMRLRDNHGLSALEWSQRRGFADITELLINASPFDTLPTDTSVNADGEIRIRSKNELGPAATAMLKAAHAKREADASRQRTSSPSYLSGSRDTASLEDVGNRIPSGDTADLEEVKHSSLPRDTAGLGESREPIPSQETLDQVKSASEQATRPEQVKQPPQGLQAAARGVIEGEDQIAADHEAANKRLTNVEADRISEPVIEPAPKPLAQGVNLSSEAEKVVPPPSPTPQKEPTRQTETTPPVDLYATQPIHRAAAAGTNDSLALGKTQSIPPVAVDTMLSSPARATAARLAPKPTAPLENDAGAESAELASESPTPAQVALPSPREKAADPGQATIKLSGSTLFSAGERSAKPRSENLFTRPVIWILASLLVGSAFVTYIVINRLAKSDGATQVSSNRTVEPTPPSAASAPVKPAPFVAGALSGAQLEIPDAEYPTKAKSDGLKGAVTVLVRVNRIAGVVIATHALNGDRLLRTAAEKAAKAAKFSPEKLPNETNVISGTITYNFGVAQTESPARTDNDVPVLGGALVGTDENLPAAEYPGAAKAKGLRGSVMVLVRVNRFGDVIAARALNGDTQLRNAAVRAAKKAKFARDKLPRETLVTSGTITYNFTAPQTEPTSAKTTSPAATSSPESPAPNPAKDNAGPVVGGDLAGKELNIPNADYPAEARRRGISGTVEMLVRVNKQGRVISWRTLKGDPLLRPAALKAAKKATFSPQKLGNSDSVLGTITYQFKP